MHMYMLYMHKQPFMRPRIIESVCVRGSLTQRFHASHGRCREHIVGAPYLIISHVYLLVSPGSRYPAISRHIPPRIPRKKTVHTRDGLTQRLCRVARVEDQSIELA